MRKYAMTGSDFIRNAEEYEAAHVQLDFLIEMNPAADSPADEGIVQLLGMLCHYDAEHGTETIYDVWEEDNDVVLEFTLENGVTVTFRGADVIEIADFCARFLEDVIAITDEMFLGSFGEDE